jgi:hypothetical protein
VVETAGLRIGGLHPTSPRPSRPGSPVAGRPRPAGPSLEVRRRYEETYKQRPKIRERARERARARVVDRTEEERLLLLQDESGVGGGGGWQEDGSGGWAITQLPNEPRARRAASAASALRGELVFADARQQPTGVIRLAGPAKAEPAPTVDRPVSSGRPAGEPAAGIFAGQRTKAKSGGDGWRGEGAGNESLYRQALAWFDDEFGDLAAAAAAQARAAAASTTTAAAAQSWTDGGKIGGGVLEAEAAVLVATAVTGVRLGHNGGNGEGGSRSSRSSSRTRSYAEEESDGHNSRSSVSISNQGGSRGGGEWDHRAQRGQARGGQWA